MRAQLALILVLFAPLESFASYDYGTINEFIVRKEFARAELALEERVAADEPEAMFRLASLYRGGQGSTRNLAASAKLYERAAQLGHLQSMYMLAQCYERGIGVASDTQTARRWYEEAAMRGDQRAAARLQTLGTHVPNLFTAIAAWRDSDAVMERLRDADLALRDPHQRTLLMATIAVGADAASQLLIGRNIDVDATDNNGRSALFYAVERTDAETVVRLIAAGAAVGLADRAGNTALHLAASGGSPPVALAILDAGGRADVRNGTDWTPMEVALARNDGPMIEALRSRGAVSPRKRERHTADEQLALLKRGEQFSGFSDLALAAWLGDRELVALRLATDAVDDADADGHTPLYWAVVRGHDDTVQSLLRAGADVDAPVGDDGSLLHVALAGGSDALVRRLIDADADLSTVNSTGQTSLLYAIERGRIDAAIALIDAGAPVNQVGPAGRSPLMAAVNSLACMRALLDHGAEVGVFDALERSPLWYAAGSNDLNVVQRLIDGGAVFTGDREGVTPLHRAATAASPAVVAALLAAGHPIDPKSTAGSSPLSLAAAQGNAAIADQLIAKGADVNQRDAAGDTPLHKAVRNDRLTIARNLILAGAKPELRNFRQANAFDLASEAGDPALVALLDEQRSTLSRLLGG